MARELLLWRVNFFASETMASPMDANIAPGWG
jgi:hypothetical protein